MTNDHVALARRWFEGIWNERRPEIYDQLLAPDSVMLSSGGELRASGEFKTLIYEPFMAAFPDLRVGITGTVGEGDQVVLRWTATGTHLGGVFGLAPTGRSIFIRGMTWLRFDEGRIIEGWDCWNRGELLDSLHSVTLTKESM
jgi:steroid delta-isomerase-like uncharacterized protein